MTNSDINPPAGMQYLDGDKVAISAEYAQQLLATLPRWNYDPSTGLLKKSEDGFILLYDDVKSTFCPAGQ